MANKSGTSEVFFLPWEEHKRLSELLERAAAGKTIEPGDFVAIKMHFGEAGGDGYIRPDFTRPIIKMIRNRKGGPFLTDTNTIYRGPRNNAVTHLQVAANHGFTQTRLQVPVIIADGLRGDDYKEIEVGGTHFKRVKIAKAISHADAIITLSHFKGHLLTGFGGVIKNLGMGCGARIGKFEMHSAAAPTVKVELCVGCEACVARCAHGALTVENKKVRFNPSLCTGCGECVLVCDTGALSMTWNEKTQAVQERLAEYAAGALKGKRAFHINFVNHITPNCDCWGEKEKPLLPDIGIFASRDPVALDQASLDAVIKKGGDVFGQVHPGIDGTIQLKHAERMGLGVRRYQLVSV